MHIAIVDDSLTDLLRLKNFIKSWLSLHESGDIKSFMSGQELLKHFIPGAFNIIFLDIIMNELNGIETARQLRRLDSRLLIVFITSPREFAFDAFELHTFDYVVKPYINKDINRVLDEAVKMLACDEPEVLIKIARSECKVPVKLISSVLSAGHGVSVNLTDGRNLAGIMKFSEIEEVLSSYKNFLTCNRGVIVNMSEI
ncbi:MAG: response regulator transcription factor [Synergistaceae bacterium]|nr:response regulator transcription factor [Synergistaceae bacterium]